MNDHDLSDEQRRKLADLDRTSGYVALWVGLFAVVAAIVVVALVTRGVL